MDDNDDDDELLVEEDKGKNADNTNKKISLDTKMKEFEFASRSYIDPKKPIIVRIDGHCFHTFTAGLNRPYEKWLHELFVKTTAILVRDFKFNLGYTQSDEITLVYLPLLAKEK